MSQADETMALKIIDLNLSLPTTPPPPPPPPPPAEAPQKSSRKQKAPKKLDEIPPPYPWATNRRAKVMSLHQLLSMGIRMITGRVQCKRCERQFEIDYEVEAKFAEVSTFITKNKEKMRQRAPEEWTNPTLPDCPFCNQSNCVKPVSGMKKKRINWLFLFLGQMVGCCKLSELKYFCKHTEKHRTGAKDRVLYLTYLELCRQLCDD